MQHKSIPYFLTLNAYWVGLSFMWNGLHVIILPAVLLHFVPDAQKNTYLGLLTFTGLVIAALLQPVAGAWSDRWVSRWGRRRPLIVLGTVFDFVFLAFLGWGGGGGGPGSSSAISDCKSAPTSRTARRRASCPTPSHRNNWARPAASRI